MIETLPVIIAAAIAFAAGIYFLIAAARGGKRTR